MFKERMKTAAIPERVFALCKVLKNKSIPENELKELFEPSYLNQDTSYFGVVKTAAQQLGLISVKENKVSLAVDKKEVETIDDMRKYIIKNIGNIKDGLFYEVTKQYMNLGDKVLTYSSVSSLEMVDYMCQATGKTVIEDDMRAWRFWSSFLGFGYLHDMLILPNMYLYLRNVIDIIRTDGKQEYKFSDFIERIRPYCGMALEECETEHKINYALSNGLRMLHDNGEIVLNHKLDSGDMWYLYSTELHLIKSTITNITIKEASR